MDKKSTSLVLVFGFFLILLVVFNLKSPVVLEQETEIEKIDDIQVVVSEEDEREGNENTGKKIKADMTNSCGDKIPVMIPGFLSDVNENSVVLNINQAGYKEKRTVLITDDTNIVEVRVTSGGDTSAEKVISINDLKINTDVVASVVEDDDGELVAEQIKNLIFEN